MDHFEYGPLNKYFPYRWNRKTIILNAAIENVDSETLNNGT